MDESEKRPRGETKGDGQRQVWEGMGSRPNIELGKWKMFLVKVTPGGSTLS